MSPDELVDAKARQGLAPTRDKECRLGTATLNRIQLRISADRGRHFRLMADGVSV